MDGSAAAAEDFRVENRVYRGNEKEPASRSTTVFSGEMVFDYLNEPAEVIVLDKAGGRFILLDTARRVRAEVTIEQVMAFTDRLLQSAGTRDDPFLRFLVAPKFDEQFDERSGELTLSSQWMTYRVLLTEAGGREIARQYRNFADWYARLNTMLHPGSKPPFARLVVNDAVARRGATPRRVQLTLTPKKSFPHKRITIRSEHELVRQVPQSDLDRVAQTHEFMRIFELIGIEQYLKR